MTKQEFIQEAALRLIGSHSATPQGITDFAMELADRIYGEDEPEPEIPYSDEPISNLIREIDRMDIEERDRKKAEARSQGHYRWSYSKKGHAKIVETACRRVSIKTVADLLAFGKYNFLGIHNMGPLATASVDKALENLYNIKSW